MIRLGRPKFLARFGATNLFWSDHLKGEQHVVGSNWLHGAAPDEHFLYAVLVNLEQYDVGSSHPNAAPYVWQQFLEHGVSADAGNHAHGPTQDILVEEQHRHALGEQGLG